MKFSKRSYASDTENPVNDSSLSSALRRLQASLRGPVFWIVIGAVVLVVAMAGPYYTLVRLNFAERLVYWGTILGLSAMLMTFLSAYARLLAQAHGWNWFFAAILAAAAGLIPVVSTLYLGEALATGFPEGGLGLTDFWSLVISVAPPLFATTLVVNVLLQYQHPTESSAKPTTKSALPAATLTRLQDKLPHHLGHDIISVHAQDHYVEITTSKGRHMMLMRLGDAVQDLKPFDGLQVHRSWWVNLSHVVRTDNGASGAELVLTSEQRIPVGRNYRAAVREATRRFST